jgi:2-dehydropantoate 2-reductase
MKIAVLGSSATADVLGGLLSQIGESVVLVDTNEPHVTAVQAQGLWIEGVVGHIHVTPQAQLRMTERPDMCLLGTEIQDIMPKLQEDKQYLQDVPVVTLQDSPHAAELAAQVLGKRYILSVATLFGATMRPGVVNYPVAGALLVGEPFESTGFAESIVALLNKIMPTTYVDSIHGAQWTKLVTSVHLSLAAVTSLTARDIAEHPSLRPLSALLMKEATDVLRTANIQLISLPGLPPVNKIVSVLHMPAPVDEMIPRMLSRIERDLFAAEIVVADLKREGEIAIEYINGEIVQLGKKVGLLAPYNDAVVKIFQHVASTRQYMSPQELLNTVEAEVRSARLGGSRLTETAPIDDRYSQELVL